MSDQRRLIRTILARPFEDGPRFSYAEWLDEHNTFENGFAARAEFIRLQLAIARRWPESSDLASTAGVYSDPERERVWGEVIFLLKLFGDEWFPDRATFDPLVRRGFYARVRCSTEVFFGRAAGLFDREPVTDVVLTDRAPVRTAAAWTWTTSAAGADGPSDVPRELYPWLADAGPFDTADEALAALSRGCVAFGRSVAGLPVLPERWGGGPRRV